MKQIAIFMALIIVYLLVEGMNYIALLSAEEIQQHSQSKIFFISFLIENEWLYNIITFLPFLTFMASIFVFWKTKKKIVFLALLIPLLISIGIYTIGLNDMINSKEIQDSMKNKLEESKTEQIN